VQSPQDREARSPRAMQTFYIVCTAWVTAHCSVVIPQAHVLAIDLGGGAAFSGFLIGSSYFLFFAGTLIARRYVVPHGPAWAKPVLGCSFVGFAVLDVLTACAVAPSPSLGLSTQMRCAMVVFGRCGLGFLLGMQLVLRNLTFQMTTKRETVQLSMLRMCSVAGGTSCGPLIIWLVSLALRLPDLALLARSLELMSGLTLLMALYWMYIFPDDVKALVQAKESQDMDDERESAPLSATHEVTRQPSTAHEVNQRPAIDDSGVSSRRMVWICGIVVFAFQSTILSGVEAASAMILQLEFNFSTSHVAICVAAALACSLPALLLITVIRRSGVITDSALAMCLLFVALAASFLYHVDISAGLAGTDNSWCLVLTADAIIFGTVYMANGIFDGLAIKWSTPDTPYSALNFMTLSAIIGTNGRFIGPMISRSVLESFGRNAYMMLQTFSVSMLIIAGLVTSREVGLLDARMSSRK